MTLKASMFWRSPPGEVARADDHGPAAVRILEARDFRMEQCGRRVPEDPDVQAFELLFKLPEADKRIAGGDRVDADKQRHRRLVQEVLDLGIAEQ